MFLLDSFVAISMPNFLPASSASVAIIIDEEFTLNCEFSWSTFPKMDIDLELEEDKTIVFIYNIVLPLVEKKMTVAIFMNNLLVVNNNS